MSLTSKKWGTQLTLHDFEKQLQQAIINADVVKVFENILTIGVEKGASDIHVEPFENYCRVRIRIDWVLSELVQYPTNIHDSIISKFKIESGQMRPDEKRLPQDARVSTTTKMNKEIDLRASTLPTVRWEKLVMRIVDKSKKIPPLAELGIEWINHDLVYKNIEMPNGIILNTGPTWSGKTTTLYAALTHINKIDVNITTFEDPVENKMLGLNQAQVRSDIGFTFASGLRAALRQDPDIIMVWEIRDHETIEMAMDAAMTWHLVFSTIHTNGAAETLTRVFNLGGKPFMVAGTFNMVMAQRLARKVCPHCVTTISVKDDPKFHYTAEAFSNMDKKLLQEEVAKRWISNEQRQNFFHKWISQAWTGKDPQTGEICPVCHGTGHKGRIGIYEVMDYTDTIKNFLLEGKTAFEIEFIALKMGMINLERDAIFKVIKGHIPFDEIYRITKHKVGS